MICAANSLGGVYDEDGLAAALDALREIHRELGHKNPVAKISSEKLNKRGISAVASRLAGKDLIIEHAAGLSNAVQNELDELMEKTIQAMRDCEDRINDEMGLDS